MTESVVITLGLPPRELHQNARPHWRLLRKVSKAYKRAAYVTTLAAGVETGPWQKSTIQATFFFSMRRVRDDVNFQAALKPAYDGIVSAGLIEDDDSEHLTTLPAALKIDKLNPRVELRIERIA